MPIWSEILAELLETKNQNHSPDFDGVRRKYLAKLYQHSNRSCILYASGWLQKRESPPSSISIDDEDIQAFMEVSHGLQDDKLDLIMHSPGGSPETAEAIILYLRSRFSDIRVIVPQLAMSAATVIACAANKVVLGKHSFLGPIDPQIVLPTSLGTRMVPAQAILNQFDQARRECEDPTKLPVWLPMLSQYGPDLLVKCEWALEMSRDLVKRCLETYMFEKEDDCSEKSTRISDWLAGHENFMSHARHIPRSEIVKHGMKVCLMEEDPTLQDLALSVFHATTQTFTNTPAIKIVENHMGRAFVKMHVAQPISNTGIIPEK